MNFYAKSLEQIGMLEKIDQILNARFISVLIVLTVSSCGGGGGGSPDPSPTTTPSPTLTPSPTPSTSFSIDVEIHDTISVSILPGEEVSTESIFTLTPNFSEDYTLRFNDDSGIIRSTVSYTNNNGLVSASIPLTSYDIPAFKSGVILVDVCIDEACSTEIDGSPIEIPYQYRIETEFEQSSDFELIWNDEFEDTQLNEDYWTALLGDGTNYGTAPGWDRNDVGWATKDAVSTENGLLVITAREEPEEDYYYSSGRIETRDKFEFTYGRIEARIKTPEGKGLSSVFALSPANTTYGDWAASGYLEIVNDYQFAEPPKEYIVSSAHYGLSYPKQVSPAHVYNINPNEDFHLYAMEWEEREIRWYINGEHYATLTRDNWWSYYYDGLTEGYVSPDGAPFNHPFFIQLHLGMAPPSINTHFPARFEIDYIRVYACPESRKPCETLNNPDVYTTNNELFETIHRVNADDFSSMHQYDEDDIPLGLGTKTPEPNLLVNTVNVGGDHGNVLELISTGESFFNISLTEDDKVTFHGVGDSTLGLGGAGSLVFDLYINSDSTDLDSTLGVSIKSDESSTSKKSINISELPHDQWVTISVAINDIILSETDTRPILHSIRDIFSLQTSSQASILLDNIKFKCGSSSWEIQCGISRPTPTPMPGEDYIVMDDATRYLWVNVWRESMGSLEVVNVSDSTGNYIRLEKHEDPANVSFSFRQGMKNIEFLAGRELVLEYLITEGFGDIIFRIDSAWPNVSDYVFTPENYGTWQELRIDVDSWLALGNSEEEGIATLTNAISPLVIQPSAHMALSVRNVRFEDVNFIPPSNEPTVLFEDNLAADFSFIIYESEGAILDYSIETAAEQSRGDIVTILSQHGSSNLSFQFKNGQRDASHLSGQELVFDYRFNAGSDLILLRMDSGWPSSSDISVQLINDGLWHEYRIDVDELISRNNIVDTGSASLSNLLSPVVLELSGGTSISFDNIRFE